VDPLRGWANPPQDPRELRVAHRAIAHLAPARGLRPGRCRPPPVNSAHQPVGTARRPPDRLARRARSGHAGSSRAPGSRGSGPGGRAEVRRGVTSDQAAHVAPSGRGSCRRASESRGAARAFRLGAPETALDPLIRWFG
jgi:hypothetical protein